MLSAILRHLLGIDSSEVINWCLLFSCDIRHCCNLHHDLSTALVLCIWCFTPPISACLSFINPLEMDLSQFSMFFDLGTVPVSQIFHFVFNLSFNIYGGFLIYQGHAIIFPQLFLLFCNARIFKPVQISLAL